MALHRVTEEKPSYRSVVLAYGIAILWGVSLFGAWYKQSVVGIIGFGVFGILLVAKVA